MKHWEEEAYRERDLRLNCNLSDGKWRFPVYKNHRIIDITNEYVKIQNVIRESEIDE